jgi:NAD(P)-dependent dehydrogenase (short-subunit alcohol dehydrogenase family)
MGASRRPCVAVVTGGAMGIGRAVVERLLAAGDHVVVVDRDEAAARKLQAELGAGAQRLTLVPGDVADPEIHERAVETALGQGELGVWVNNAAYAVAGSVHETSAEDFQRGLAVNFGGVFWGTAAAVRAMLAGATGGSIVNLTSVQALRGFPHYALYASTKGAIIALTQQVAAEFADRGIRCNAVAPGVILTEMNRRIFDEAVDQDALRRAWQAQTPVGRVGEPEDVAAAVTYLASADASFITGQVLVIDGGMTVVPPDYGLRFS